MDAATVYARQSVPDAIAALRPDAVLMRNLATAKLQQSSPVIGVDLAGEQP